MRIHNPICTDPQKFEGIIPEVVNILERTLSAKLFADVLNYLRPFAFGLTSKRLAGGNFNHKVGLMSSWPKRV